ncbi:MAG: hypothetical protein WDN28_25525 [Chthoniobacter sp.]
MMYVGSAPAFVIHILHLRETDYGWLFIPLIGGMTAGSYVAGRCSHRFSGSALIGAGFAIMVVAASVNLAYAALVPAAIPWAIVAPMFYCFGMALATPAMTVRALEVFPRHRGLAASPARIHLHGPLCHRLGRGLSVVIRQCLETRRRGGRGRSSQRPTVGGQAFLRSPRRRPTMASSKRNGAGELEHVMYLRLCRRTSRAGGAPPRHSELANEPLTFCRSSPIRQKMAPGLRSMRRSSMAGPVIRGEN